jgi:hypothetical protein
MTQLDANTVKTMKDLVDKLTKDNTHDSVLQKSEIIKCPSCTFNNIFQHNAYIKTCLMCSCSLGEYSIIEKNFMDMHTNIPEFLVPRNMIHLKGKINGVEIKFLVDTGANGSTMPLSVAKMCDIDNLINTTFEGTAIGVGSKKIYGKICYIEIFFDFGCVPVSFNIIEDNQEKFDPVVLLGLDIMCNHGFKIDFKNRYLEVNEHVKIPFIDTE